MPKKKDPSFSFYPNFDETANRMKDPMMQLEFYRSLGQYVFSDGKEPEFSCETVSVAFQGVKPSLDTSLAYIRAGSKGGKKSGEVRQAKASQKKPSEAKASKVHEEERETEEEREDEKRNRSYENMPPTLEEVRAYFDERGAGSDPEVFYDYYTANGWIQGKGKPLKDWKAAARNWERNHLQRMEQKKDGSGDPKRLAKTDKHTEGLQQWSDRPNPSSSADGSKEAACPTMQSKTECA